MAESSKVRLVRCPKCENLLPELADYSLYQCGGCGAVLRAKDKNKETEVSLEKLDEEKIAGVATELYSPEKGVAELSGGSDTDVKSSAGSLRSEEKNFEKNDIDFVSGRSGNQCKATSGKRVVENSRDEKMDRDGSDNAVGLENSNLNSRNGHNSISKKPEQISDQESGEMEGFRRVLRSDIEGMRFSTSNYPDEGSSSYYLNSSYGYREPMRNHNDQNGANRIKYLENDRVELLRKLDELKEQLSKSCGLADLPKENVPNNVRAVPSDPYGGSSTWFPGSSSTSDRSSMQYSQPEKQAARPPYFSNQPEPFPYTNRHEMLAHNFHPLTHKSHQISGYADHFGPQMHRRVQTQLSGQYQQPSRQYFSGNYFDTTPLDPFDAYPPNAPFHHPSCSCFHCYESHHEASVPMPPSTFYNKRFPDLSNNPIPYHQENLRAFGPHVPNSRTTVPPSNFQASQSHTGWPSDVNTETGRFGRRPRRVMLTSGGKSCRPVAGGSPFFTCFNCYELLQLPKKIELMAKNQHKMRCGACSAVINFTVANRKLVLSADAEPTQLLTEVDSSSNEILKDNAVYTHDHTHRINVNFSSDDYDNSDYDFQTIDTDPIVSSTGQGLSSSNPQEMHSFHSSSPSASEDETSPDVLVAQREMINPVKQPVKGVVSPPPPGSPLQQHFDYSSNNHIANRLGKGNRSSRSEQEKVVMNKAATRQNSLKEASLATEMEVSFNEYSNTGVSHDSVDTNREDNHSKHNKGGESFFTNIIKKSFKDLSRSNQAEDRRRSNVYVNGHHLPDRVVKKAEKLAGPIHPGKYWYDYRAGFWGVIGGPCLGIIPPFIEEFNYSLPENCAGGNTGVFVNGRELHQKDLDLLASRGLPTDRDRSYIVEISGRVLDEDSSEELDGLGKLAPTVEKVKHGFGMKVPKALA